MRLKLWPRSANSSRPEMAMRWDRSPSASARVPRKSSASGARKPLQQQHHQRERQQNGEDRMDLADRSSRLRSRAASASILIDLGGLVGDRDLDQLVELLVDAAFRAARAASTRRRRGVRGCAIARPRRAGPSACWNSFLMASRRSSSADSVRRSVGGDHGELLSG